MARTAVVVLDSAPEREAAEEIAQRVARQYADDDQDNIIWSIDTEIPVDINVGLADQLEAYKRDAGPDACFMTIVMCNDEEVDGIYSEE